MYHRKFNSVMSQLNEIWAANALNMNVNLHPGIDLLGEEKNVEVKFNLQARGIYRHRSWRVLDHELAYQNGKSCFWALGFYWLTDDVANINVQTQLALERRVTERELFIVGWDWMNRFDRYHESGETRKSKWNNCLRFPKYNQLPSVVNTYKVKNGRVHLTEGVDPSFFKDMKIISP